MNKADLMRDPFFAQLMFRVESPIHRADQDARRKGIELLDSNIKSSLNKAKILARGRSIQSKPASERERIIHALAGVIHSVRADIRAGVALGDDATPGVPISNADWIATLEAVEASLKTHTHPGERLYLDFLDGFMANAEGVEGKPSWWRRVVSSCRRAKG